MVALSRDDVAHVAHLARLWLTDDELTLLEGQLNHILDQYAKLAELDTEQIPPTAQTIELENILRDDLVRPSLDVEAVLANAPERSGDHFVVPVVIGDSTVLGESAAGAESAAREPSTAGAESAAREPSTAGAESAAREPSAALDAPDA